MSEAATAGMATFKHSGDLGDIIFALPTVRALGGGVIYLDPEGGQSSPLVNINNKNRTKLTARTIVSLTPLLRQQPYVHQVCFWEGQPVNYDLDQFRLHIRFHNLSDSHLQAFRLPFSQRDLAWLTVADPIVIENRPLVISRSVRYQGNHTFWEDYLPKFKDRCVFVGFPKDHEIFEYTFGHKVLYYPTPDLLTLARVIAGCEQFFGNQGLPHALAEGMKKNLINEWFWPCPASVFNRNGALYV
jgi:hypothetical protein